MKNWAAHCGWCAARAAFDRWLAEAAPVDPKEAAAEAATINRDALAASVAALPLAERTSLIDQLLATNVAEIKAA
jgi:hypothetical protein